MTRNQILKALEDTNVNIYAVGRDMVEIARYDEDGRIDPEATEADAMEAAEVLNWNGYRAGWGGWVLKPKTNPINY